MYVKLALENAKKSIKDYLIYFITITICVSLFYAFMSLSSSSYELITEKSYKFEVLKAILKYSTYVITGVLIILVGYVNKYMMKRRQREFATYILLGSEQKSVALMFFIETLIVGIMAIICGICIGTLFSQVVTAIVLITAKQEVVFNFRLYMDTVVITFIFFISMFCIIGVYNIRVLRKLKLINMMNVEKKTEFQFKRSCKFYAVVFGLSVILYSVGGYCTYKLNNKGYSAVDYKNGLIFQVISLVSFIVATYLLFYSIAYIIIFIKERCINFKYENTNLFLIGSIVSKIKTAPILMATICITFLGAAISFMLTLVMSQWSLGYLDYRVPFDIDVRNEYSYRLDKNTSLEDINDIPKIDYGEVIKYLNDNNYDVEEYCQVEKYFLNKEDFYIRDENNIPIIAVKLSDFNKLRSMLGYKEIELKDNEFTTQWQKIIKEDDIKKSIKKNSVINVGGKNLNISDTGYYTESFGEGVYNIHSDHIIVLPDKLCENLTLASTNLLVNTKNEVDFEKIIEFKDNYIYNWFKSNNENLTKKYNNKNGDISEYLIDARVKSFETNNILNATLAMRILGIYLGTVLLMISLTVLALQQLSDSIEHKSRFNVLKKLGVEEKDINKIILKQISIYFIIPIFIALIGFVIFIFNYYILNSDVINSYIGDKAFVINIIIAMILMIFIYVCYFAGTYYTFKRNIKSREY